MRDLSPIVEAIHLKAVADLETHTTRVRSIRKKIFDLQQHKKGTIHDAFRESEAAFEGDIAFRWHQWIDSKIEELNLELARELARRPAVLAHARKSFGKMEAVKKITEIGRAEARAQKLRRSAYES